MTRTVADAALMQNITSGPHPIDHDSIRSRMKLPLKAESIKGRKIAYSLDFGYMELDGNVRRNTLAALEAFRALGATVEEVDLGWGKSVDDVASTGTTPWISSAKPSGTERHMPIS